MRTISLYFFDSFHTLNLSGFDVSLGLLRRLIGLSGKIQLLRYKLEYWTFMALNASNIIGNLLNALPCFNCVFQTIAIS